MNETDVTLSEAKQKALATLNANQKHQAALVEYISRLTANIHQADLVIEEGNRNMQKDGTLIEDAEKEHLCIHAPGSIKLRMMTTLFDKEGSPFKQDTEQRQRYEIATTPRPWNPTDRKNLRDAVIKEQKRAFAIQAKKERHPDPLGYAQSQTDEFYLNRDASQLDWERVAAIVSAAFGRGLIAPRKAIDCRVCWLGDEQPCIKKGPWDASDIKKFTRIMKEVLKAIPAETVEDISPDAEDTSAPKVKIDWSDVSRRMDGTRTAVQCLRRWLSDPPDLDAEEEEEEEIVEVATTPIMEAITKPPVKSKGKSTWTDDEDNLLREAIKTYGTNSWSAVAIALQTGRTARQCSERWRLSIDPDIRRGKFTPDEDEALIKAVETHGSSWAKIREMVVGRTAAQCRERWVNHLDPNVKHSAPWTPEEDTLLSTLRTTRPDMPWASVAKEITGRTDNQCYRRWTKVLAPRVEGFTDEASTSKKAKPSKRKAPQNTTEDAERASEPPAVSKPPEKGKEKGKPRGRKPQNQPADESVSPATQTSLSGPNEEPSAMPSGSIEQSPPPPKKRPRAKPKPKPKAAPDALDLPEATTQDFFDASAPSLPAPLHPRKSTRKTRTSEVEEQAVEKASPPTLPSQRRASKRKGGPGAVGDES